MRHILISAAIAAVLAGCSSGEKTARFLIDPPAPTSTSN